MPPRDPPPAPPPGPAHRGGAAGTATGRVYEGIYLAVLERRLAAGAWLREEELAGSFGVSRTVVRQALHRLAQHQVVELIHNRGARVPSPELADAEHVFEARRVAECEIARRLGGRLGTAQLEELTALAEQERHASEAGDAARAVRLSGEFHQALARMHGNPVLARLLDSLLPTTSLLMSRFAASGQPVCVAHRHVELISALRLGAAAAAAEMKQHLAELQTALTRPAPRPPATLRDLFAGYREAGEPAPSAAPESEARTRRASRRAAGSRAARAGAAKKAVPRR
ncbi:MAG: GntR family transcriptional regulator [Rubrivivax sp.]|nr:GntR family transcriptional regulator [Rubrivivax sp.]